MNAVRLPRLILAFLLGAVLGTLLDGIHAYGDVLTYPHPDFGEWAWFVPVEFGLVAAVIALAIPDIERRVAPGATPILGLPRLVGEVLLFALLYLCTVLVDGHGAWPALLATAMTVLAVARIALERVPGDWFWALAGAIAGPIGEAIISGIDAFSYTHPDFLGVPIWLPPLWANAGLMIRRVIARIVMSP